jgi:hypothetical protein
MSLKEKQYVHLTQMYKDAAMKGLQTAIVTSNAAHAAGPENQVQDTELNLELYRTALELRKANDWANEMNQIP